MTSVRTPRNEKLEKFLSDTRTMACSRPNIIRDPSHLTSRERYSKSNSNTPLGRGGGVTDIPIKGKFHERLLRERDR